MEYVAVKKCSTYNQDRVYEKIKDLLDNLGGLENMIKPDDRVLLKVNMLMDKNPEDAVTTNPEVVRAVVKLVQDVGGKVIIGDSPGGPFTTGRLKRAYEKTGLTEVAESTGSELNYDINDEVIGYPGGRYNKSFTVGKYITNADFIINLPKLKTHGMTMYTGAVKNLFGAIPGLLKAEYHLKMPGVGLFTVMLVELSQCINPGLNIMDAIVGMEGHGPSAGIPRDYGYLLASRSALAIDLAAIYLMGINPLNRVPQITAAEELGFISKWQDIEIIGDELMPAENVKIPVIEKASNLLDQRLPRPIANLLDRAMKPKPIFIHKDCIGCGDCCRSCPAKVIAMVNNKPIVKLNNCIRCFCCQELCKYQAVKIKRPLLGRILFRL